MLLKLSPLLLLVLSFFLLFILLNNSDEYTDYNYPYEYRLFTRVTCPHCRNVKDFLSKNDPEKKLDVGELNADSTKYINGFIHFCKKAGYDVSHCGVPLLHVKSNDQVILGDEPIIEFFQTELDRINKLESENDNQTDNTKEEILDSEQNPSVTTNTDSTISTASSESNNNLSLPIVIFGGLADSFNPCAWSALIFLVTTLFSMKSSKKKLTKIGISYIVTIYLSYLAIGLGILGFLQVISQWLNILYIVLAVVVAMAAVIELKDVFWYGKGISLKIPENKWPLIKSYMQKSTIPATIIVGAMISILEFGCTGGIYTPIIAMLSKRESAVVAFLYLIVYNLMFVLPLIVILVLAINGYSYEKVEAFRNKNKKLMRLISGLVMVALAIWLFIQGSSVF